MANHQPTFLDPRCLGHEILRQGGVIGVEGLEFSRLDVQALNTAAEGTDPDVAPLVFSDRPDVVIEQCPFRVRCNIIMGMAIGNVNETAIVGTKPYRAVLGRIRGNHDVGSKTVVGLVKYLGLTCLRIILDDTTVVGAQPVVALMVFRRGVDITQLQRLEANHFLDILVQSVTVGGNPHAAVVVEQQVFTRVLTERGGIELVVLKLLHFLALGVDNEKSFMVCDNPHPTTLVHTDIPYLQRIGQRIDAQCCQIAVQRVVPPLLFLIKDKQVGRDNPEVVVLVGIDVISLIGFSTMGLWEIVAPQHLAFFTVKRYQFTHTGNHQQLSVPFSA